MLSAICFNLDQSKILSSGYGLTILRKKNSVDIVGKGENVGNQRFCRAGLYERESVT